MVLCQPQAFNLANHMLRKKPGLQPTNQPTSAARGLTARCRDVRCDELILPEAHLQDVIVFIRGCNKAGCGFLVDVCFFWVEGGAVGCWLLVVEGCFRWLFVDVFCYV